MDRRITRRSVLQLGGIASLGALAGCSTSLMSDDGLSLGDIVITDSSAAHHTIRIELKRGNEFVREETYDFPGPDGRRKRTIQATWSREPAVYTLYTIVQGPLGDEESDLNLYVSEFTTEDVASDAEDCSVVHVRISQPPESGSVGIGTAAPRPKWGSCPDGSNTTDQS